MDAQRSPLCTLSHNPAHSIQKSAVWRRRCKRFVCFGWLACLAVWPFVGCSGFDVGIFAEANSGSQMSVTLNAGNPSFPAVLTSNLAVTITNGSFGTGEMELRRAVIEYCVPREGATLSGDEVLRSSCVKEDLVITHLEIASLRLPASLDAECYTKEGTASPCHFPNGRTPITLEVLSDAGTLSPSTEDWKGTKEQRQVETVDGKRVTTSFLPGPCNHPKYIDFYMFVGFKEDPDTSYAIRSNGTETTIFSQDNPKTKFKLVCNP